jgi:outer membrane lipoprotein-sorting protein
MFELIVNSRWSMVNGKVTLSIKRADIYNHNSLLKFFNLKKTNYGPSTMDYRLSTVVCGLLFSIFSFTTANAQYTGFTPITDLTAFKKQFSTEAKKITSIKSNFVQEKNLALLEEKITSEGKFTFKRENKVRIEYLKPFQYLMIMNADEMLVRDNQKESKVNVKSNKLFQQVNKIMVDCVQGTMLDNKDFTVKVFQDDKTWLLEMTPVGKALKDFFQTIIIYAEKKDYSVSSIDMREPSGDNTIIRFVQKELNTTVSDNLFAVK